MYTHRSVSGKGVQRIVSFAHFLFVCLFVFYFVSFYWDHMGVKVSKDISESTHYIHSLK